LRYFLIYVNEGNGDILQSFWSASESRLFSL